MKKDKVRMSHLSRIKDLTFTVSMAREAGLSFYDLQLLLKMKRIEKVSRGLYSKISKSPNENQEMVNSLIQLGQPSCVCLLSALYLHGITDEIPNETWVYVPIDKNSRLSSIKIIRKRKPEWAIGIVKKGGLRVTTIERTLIDCLTDKKHFTQLDAIKYTKTALEDKMTNVEKLFKMAKKLKVDHRVKMILTMLQEEYV